jgi:hypothetical protein
MPPAMREDQRSFEIEDSSIGHRGGRYVSTSPAAAGKNAGKTLFRLIDNEPEYAALKGATAVVMRIREITRLPGVQHRSYTYRVTRVGRPTSKRQVFNGPDGVRKEFVAAWVYHVESVDDDDLSRAKVAAGSRPRASRRARSSRAQ